MCVVVVWCVHVCVVVVCVSVVLVSGVCARADMVIERNIHATETEGGDARI
jgi:hypothetical protein